MAYTQTQIFGIIGNRNTWTKLIKNKFLDRYKKIEGTKVVFDIRSDEIKKLYQNHIKNNKGGRAKKTIIKVRE